MRLHRYAILAGILLLVPAAALVVIGILVLAFRQGPSDTAFGVLILLFCGALLAGAVVAVIALWRSARLSQLQTDLLSKVSHEFRTPLTAIRMFVDALSNGRELSPAQHRTCVEGLDREARRLERIIERWLQLGRMEAGRVVYTREPVRLETVIDKALRVFRQLVHGDLEVEIDLEPGLPRVMADSELLAHALFNLLHNAYKYGGRPPWIRVGARVRDGKVEISVADNGPGIPRRERRRIFRRFYRIDDRLSGPQQGTGLGLAIVRHVVRAHGGRIRVREREGGGAELVIVLPVKEPSEAMPPAGAEPGDRGKAAC